MVKKTILLLAFLLLPSLCFAANGDITACRIKGTDPGNGWVLQIDIESSGGTPINVGGTYAMGLGTNNDPSTAKTVLTVTSLGFDATGTATTVARSVYGTVALRKPYPDQATMNESLAAGVLTIEVALSDFVYAKDKAGAGNSGTDITIAIASGLYTQGGQASSAFSGTVTNNSTLAYPKVIGRWAWPGYERVTGDFLVEMVGFHRSAKDGKPLACVKFNATDASLNAAATQTATAMTKSTRTGDANTVLVYAATVPVTALTQGEVLTVNFTAYPWIGDSGSVLNSAVGVDGVAQPDERLGPLYFANDKAGTYGVSFAVVDPASTGANASVAATQAAAEAAYAGNVNTAYATINAAAAAIKTYNNSTHSRNEAGGGTILLAAANHEILGAAGTAMGTMTSWLTITKLSTITETQAVINANTSNRQWSCERLKLQDISLGGGASVSLLLYGNATTGVLWMDLNTINIGGSAGIVSWRTAYATRNTVEAYTLGFSHNGTTKCPYGLIRGNVGANSSYTSSQMYNVLGNSQVSPSITYLTGNAQGQSITTNAIFAFNTLKNLNAAFTPVDVFTPSLSTTATNNIAVVQNVMENRLATSPLISLAAVAQQVHTSSNILLWHNTTAGARTNLGYNGYGASPILHHLYHQVGNHVMSWNQHQNDVDATFDASNGARIGGWSLEFAVGMMGNYIRTSSVSAGFFHGINTIYTGTDGFVDDQSSTSGTKLGNGNYHLTASSSALSLIPSGKAVLPYDLDGNPRYNDGRGSAGAYEYRIQSGGGAALMLGF
jgi:hypothetical protein